MQDNEWAAAACSGDEEAFNRLMTLYRRRLYGIAYSYVGNENDALEVLQEAVCRAWVNCGKLKNPALFLPWLIRITINCCMDELKRRKNQAPVHFIHAEAAAAAEMMDVRKVDLLQALSGMKPKYRHALMLRYYQDMTVPEVADVLDKPEGTIKTWLHQGLKQLRRQLTNGGERYDR
ncbi:RNA polymerase sigma factor [Paenibacillus physcomitrellae]|uniref:DNA-directed RNA polymerase sigma-70 factor n=1 Tax=Paenibacillus physcomitrellae TaxID=1619311 RepID=A0ABQ1GSS5_9BACL|nr:RNA polymerase sigma factor [Paenibacillus physcomitrellae]GGA49656.1 DNA-directed RNA polymerase sigma-70 factor [Paenibacillus physcomitrellae]